MSEIVPTQVSIPLENLTYITKMYTLFHEIHMKRIRRSHHLHYHGSIVLMYLPPTQTLPINLRLGSLRSWSHHKARSTTSRGWHPASIHILGCIPAICMKYARQTPLPILGNLIIPGWAVCGWCGKGFSMARFWLFPRKLWWCQDAIHICWHTRLHHFVGARSILVLWLRKWDDES